MGTTNKKLAKVKLRLFQQDYEDEEWVGGDHESVQQNDEQNEFKQENNKMIISINKKGDINFCVTNFSLFYSSTQDRQ